MSRDDGDGRSPWRRLQTWLPGFRPQEGGTSGSARAAGAEKERLGEKHLRRQGYRIVARNVTYRFGEIDLVAREGETLAFVEVKSRTDDRFGPAVLAVDREKRRRVILAARAYLTEQPWDGPVRFDVLGIDGVGAGRRFTLLRGAFEADEG